MAVRPWTVEFQVPEIIDVPAETEAEAIEKAWEAVKRKGYLWAGATQQPEVLEPDH